MILITGATGALGRPLAHLLAREGAKVRAVTRDPGAAHLPGGVEVVRGDPSRPDTLARHLDGVTTVLLHSRACGDTPGDLLALAREHGAGKVVALSAVNVDDPLGLQPSRAMGDRNKETDAAAAESGMEWTSLRASSFAGNALVSWGAQIRAGDVVRYVYADFAEPLLDERDLVEVGARALLTDDLAGRRLELTGPESVSHERAVTIIGEAAGRPLRFEEVAPEAAEEGMVRRGLPRPFVSALMARYARYAALPPAEPTGAVEEALGRPARSFARWAADHAPAFRL
ncbi:NAD(P)H-binding protein [Nonomuraea roseoviolacea subsp. roseoviolacea]|uniref:NAD(P)H-binding protein n=1 Tax=Nonomuraea roseoviolacea TaxID=103837 RepID=UPI0031D1FFF7